MNRGKCFSVTPRNLIVHVFPGLNYPPCSTNQRMMIQSIFSARIFVGQIGFGICSPFCTYSSKLRLTRTATVRTANRFLNYFMATSSSNSACSPSLSAFRLRTSFLCFLFSATFALRVSLKPLSFRYLLALAFFIVPANIDMN
jgi:hypothetical protein